MAMSEMKRATGTVVTTALVAVSSTATVSLVVT